MVDVIREGRKLIVMQSPERERAKAHVCGGVRDSLSARVRDRRGV
jgi:hypothetical protein